MSRPSPSRARAKRPDDAVVAAALPRAEACLATLAGLKQPGPFLLGEQLTLADLHAAPMFFYFAQAKVAAPMIERHPAFACLVGDDAGSREFSRDPSFQLRAAGASSFFSYRA